MDIYPSEFFKISAKIAVKIYIYPKDISVLTGFRTQFSGNSTKPTLSWRELRKTPKSSVRFSGVPRNFFRGRGGVSTNSVEDRENGDLVVVAP